MSDLLGNFNRDFSAIFGNSQPKPSTGSGDQSPDRSQSKSDKQSADNRKAIENHPRQS